MIELVNRGNSYYIKNIDELFTLIGEVVIDDISILLIAGIYNGNNKLADCTYTYRSGGKCAKVLSNLFRTYIEPAELLLENTLSFLLQKFNFS